MINTHKEINVDPVEVEKFSAIAAKWWDLEGEFKPLHQINPLRLAWIESQSQGLSGKKVLDVGCGGGILAESMATKGALVTGIDMAPKSLNVAKLHGLESGIKVNYQLIPVEALAEQQAGEYDVVTCMEMLEHVPNPASIIHACATLAKPGGRVFFSTLNRHAKAFLLAIVGAEYVMNMLPKGTHQYDHFIKPGELAQMAEATGLNLLNFKGLSYHPLSKCYYLSDDTSVNYMLSTQKPSL